MENEKLLPCPFCGGSAEYRNDGMTGYVQCQNCLARTDGVYSWRDENWKEEVAREWNTRVYPKEVQDAICREKPFKPEKRPYLYEGKFRECKCEFIVRKYMNFCPNCGQKLYWGE